MQKRNERFTQVVGVVHQNSVTKYEQVRISHIVEQSPEALKQIEFVDAAKLEGCLLNIDNDSIKVELAWKTTNKSSFKRRTVYLMEAS